MFKTQWLERYTSWTYELPDITKIRLPDDWWKLRLFAAELA